MHGQFQRADGLILPNNISKRGAQVILGRAFKPSTVSALVLSMGLCKGSPAPLILISEIQEPTIGVNGYARANCQAEAQWPDEGEIGGQRYVQTQWFTFTATGSGFDKPINRLFLAGSMDYSPSNNVFALSAPLPADLTILSSTPSIDRTFRYQLFL